VKRLQLFEIHDQPWCPASLRDTLTNYLATVLRVGRMYHPVIPLLHRALERAGTRQVVDLASGSGGPWLDLAPLLARDGVMVDVCLTDKYPNPAGARGGVRYHPRPVDATAVPKDLEGFRTMFTSFHHFRPEAARAILADAVRSGRGIGAFEVMNRSLLAMMSILLTPLMILVGMPFVRPFRWAHLFWTYVIPAFPLMETFDGLVSCLRTYTPAELRELTAGLGEGKYVWEIGEVRSRWAPVPVTYCIGYPRP
jgi:hypothetical protein